MTTGRIEVLVEPFKEDNPGPHVMAVVDVLKGAGLGVEMGPFATIAEGPLDDLVAIMHTLVASGFEAGATSIQARIERL